MLTPYLLFFYRARCIDSDKVPADGPAIIAPNHFSFLDHFFVAVYLRRKVHFMAKSQLFTRPMQFIYTHGGVFPVRRGQRDEEAFKTADAILKRGGLIVMYAEGGPLAQRRARRAAAGHRPARARVRRADRARRRSPAPSGCATGSGSSSRRSRCSSASRSRFEQVEEPTREQAQAASEMIFDDVRALHSRLRKEGRKRVVKAARAARRAAGAAARAGRSPGTAYS